MQIFAGGSPIFYENFRQIYVYLSRDMHEAFLVETERDRDLEARDRGRDRGVDNSSRGETETKAIRARDRDEAEAYQLRGETEPRHTAPRDGRGIKTEATSHVKT